MNLGMILESILASKFHFFRTSSEVLVEVISPAGTSTSKVPGVRKSNLFEDFLNLFLKPHFGRNFDDFGSLLGSILAPSGTFF